MLLCRNALSSAEFFDHKVHPLLIGHVRLTIHLVFGSKKNQSLV